jgi:hypothetical protein
VQRDDKASDVIYLLIFSIYGSRHEGQVKITHGNSVVGLTLSKEMKAELNKRDGVNFIG